MRHLIRFAALLIAFSASSAHATIVYDIFFRSTSTFGDANNNTFFVTPGQTITGVEAVLRETVTGGDSSALAVSNVNGFGISISVSGSNGSTDNKVTDTTGGSPATSDGPAFYGYFALSGGRSAGPDDGGVREFVFGTIDLVGPTTGATTFSLLDPNPVDGDITTFSGPGAAGLEAVATSGAIGSPTITLEAVPEPTSLLMLSSVIGVGAYHRRRRRKKAALAADGQA